MGAGPMSVPSGSPGANAQALATVRQALQLLQSAQVKFPIGSDPWSGLDRAIAALAKVAPESAENRGVEAQSLRNLQQSQSADAQMDAVMRSLGGAGAAAGGGAGVGPAPSPAAMA